MITLRRVREIKRQMAEMAALCDAVEIELIEGAQLYGVSTDKDVSPVVGTRATGALRRKSMDLTRELSDLRNSQKGDK